MDKLTYLLQTQQHIYENIRFADQKAGVFITVDTALLGALYGAKLLHPTGPWWLIALSWFAFASLALSVTLAALVLKPRGVKKHQALEGGNLAVPEKIPRATVDEFTSKFDEADWHGEAIRDTAALVHVRSEVNNDKYRWLDRAIYASAVAWVAVGALIVAARLEAVRIVQWQAIQGDEMRVVLLGDQVIPTGPAIDE